MSAERLSLIRQINNGPVTQGLKLLPLAMDSVLARGQMLKIGLQESRLLHRDQLEKGGTNTVLGPALGLWQFERGGAVTGLMNHAATKAHLRSVCKQRNVTYSRDAIWKQLKVDDAFAAALARLNLYWHPDRIPGLLELDKSWDYYTFCWRPGRPHRETWDEICQDVYQVLANK